MSYTFCITRCQIQVDAENRKANLVVREFDPRNHHDPAVASFPVVVADETAFAGTALSLCELCEAEADVRGRVEGRWVEDGDAVPAGLDLDGEMSLKASGRF